MYQPHTRELLNQKDARSDAGRSRPLYQATERLIRALDRMERSVQHQLALQKGEEALPAQMQLFESENASLKEEHAHLNATILQLREQYDDLQHVASTIYNKLNDSIDRLTHLIDA